MLLYVGKAVQAVYIPGAAGMLVMAVAPGGLAEAVHTPMAAAGPEARAAILAMEGLAVRALPIHPE
jgi:hypothetical protein